MTPERWASIKEIVGAALECSADARPALLERACLADHELRTEVESLLQAYAQADVVTRGWVGSFGGAIETPTVIGPYRLEREIGAGGMGQVWLAEQTEPVRRQVALKLIRAGLYDWQVTERFLAERQSLALMNHPAIAKIFDAGATPAGQPYLVMEYVDGQPINSYCDGQKMSVVERLKLFQLVCEGVQHAHQKAIIHRDLKPSNILITEVDGKPMPRIIDFGVAKGVSRAHYIDAQLTQAGAVVGTLGYMSPEQAEIGDDVDTRSDVYSLGVVLYELLTGVLPFDPKQLNNRDSRHRLRDAGAQRPSAVLRSMGKTAVKIANDRSTETMALIRRLRGDLDLIVLKTLEQDPDRRYATPSALAADIGNQLRSEPVSAHAPSMGYRIEKYFRRHRLGVGVSAGVIALLVAFGVVQTVQLRSTRLQRDRADRIAAFMTDIFRVPNPSEARGSTVTAREILDQSSRAIESGTDLDPAVRSQLIDVMAETYLGLGLYSRAHDLAKRALDSRTQLLGADDPKTLESMRLFASILNAEGRSLESESLLRNTIERQSKLLGAEHLSTLETQHVLALLLIRGAHFVEAEALERQIIVAETKKLGPDDARTLSSINSLAASWSGQSRFAEAEPLYRQVLERRRRTLGPTHPDTLASMQNLANMLAEQGRYAEAEPLYRETLATEQRVLGAEHPRTASTMTTLANTVVHGAMRKKEAEALYRTAFATLLRVAGPENVFTTRAQEGLANVLMSEGKYTEAEDLFRSVLQMRQRLLGRDDTDVLLTQFNLGLLLKNEKHYAEAETMMRQTLDQQTRVLEPDDPDTLASKAALATILFEQGRAEEAERYARLAYEAQMRRLGPQHDDTQVSLRLMALARSKLGRYDQADAAFRDTIDKIDRLPHGNAAHTWYQFAGVAAIAGRADDAFEYLNKAIVLGYPAATHMEKDEDLSSLHDDRRFVQTLAFAQNKTLD